MKKLLKSQMKDVPEEQQQMIMELIEKEPELFQKIAMEMNAELKTNGNNQMAAAMKVLPKYQQQIMSAMSPEMQQQLASMMGGQQTGQFRPDGTINS